ncbi:MAG: hypothetical protein K2H52_04430 [Lachnospiraceae bacterium]|nr:hypothetical protein [Lachnospiraceae bacterium]MDE6184382.1 hypothetical protein [Lachnospiraceae bacterium]
MTRVIFSDARRKKEEKRRMKERRKRRKRVNVRIERTVSFLAILICVVFSVLEILEKKQIKGGTGRKEGAAGDE